MYLVPFSPVVTLWKTVGQYHSRHPGTAAVRGQLQRFAGLFSRWHCGKGADVRVHTQASTVT